VDSNQIIYLVPQSEILMKKEYLVLTVLVFSGPLRVDAQGSTTNCQIIGAQVMCNTQQGIVQLRGWGEDLGQSLGNFANAYINSRRQAQARKAYTAALQEAQERAQAQVELQKRAFEEIEARARADAIAVNEREQARQRLFAEKAISVVLETAEGMRFQGKVQSIWVQAVSSTLQDLFKVKPEASRLEIFDAISPKLMIVLRARDEYVRRHLSNEPLFGRFQRLEIKALGDSVAHERFWLPVTRAVEPLFMEWPDEINVERFAKVVEPIFSELEKSKTESVSKAAIPQKPTSPRPGGTRKRPPR
jgi:hypothetical protein